MIAPRRLTRAIACGMLMLITSAGSASPQQVPNRFVVVRNDSTAELTIEFRDGDTWQKIALKAGKDTTLTSDRVRVSTTRNDDAVITVEMPVKAGGKYRLAWNDAAGMWDFSASS